MLRLLLVFASFFLGLSAVWALPDPGPNPVLDQAGVVQPHQQQRLNQQILQIQKDTKAQVGILLIDSTNGQDISQYTIEVAEKWGVGHGEDDNGLMLVVAVNDRRWFAATGYGLEGVLPDILVKRIGEAKLTRPFRISHYAGGLSHFLTEVERLIKQDPGTIERWSSNNPTRRHWLPPKKIPLSYTIAVVALGAIALLVIGMIFNPKGHQNRHVTQILPVYISLGGLFAIGGEWIYFVMIFLVTLYYILTEKDFSKNTHNWHAGGSWSGGSSFSSSSGFGGFGGGSFGGGGAGGGW